MQGSERGFRYPLGPVLQRGQHLMEASLLHLARARLALAQGEERCRLLQSQAAAQASLARQAWKRRPDPLAQQRTLAYLAQLQEQHAQAEKECDRLRDEAAAAANAAWQAMRQRDALASHRQEALRLHRQAADAKASAQTDDDWLARSRHVAGDKEEAT